MKIFDDLSKRKNMVFNAKKLRNYGMDLAVQQTVGKE